MVASGSTVGWRAFGRAAGFFEAFAVRVRVVGERFPAFAFRVRPGFDFVARFFERRRVVRFAGAMT